MWFVWPAPFSAIQAWIALKGAFCELQINLFNDLLIYGAQPYNCYILMQE